MLLCTVEKKRRLITYKGIARLNVSPAKLLYPRRGHRIAVSPSKYFRRHQGRQTVKQQLIERFCVTAVAEGMYINTMCLNVILYILQTVIYYNIIPDKFARKLRHTSHQKQAKKTLQTEVTYTLQRRYIIVCL